jgi:hypothetical protein
MTRTTITKTTYSWGTVRVLTCGASYSLVLFPDIYAAVEALPDGGLFSFADETGRVWSARRRGTQLHFRTDRQGYRFTVDAAALA